jgi:predicted nucleotidyltransferase
MAMNQEIETRLNPLRQLCEQHRVARLDLFGSATGHDFDPERSDFDFLVEFQAMPPVEHADAFFGLLEDLERLFGRHVDLLEPGPIRNPFLWSSIEQSRKALYEAA